MFDRSTSPRCESAARRRALAGLAAAGTLLLPLRPWASVVATPAMAEGPFYPERFDPLPSPRLLRGESPGAEPLRLEGRVRDVAGRPLAAARVEIWQCDAGGRYHHSRDSRPDERDPQFGGFGWMPTDDQGRYAFDTIRPVPYPGRTPHIHLAVLEGGRRRLVTQIFVDGEAGNARDVLYRWLPDRAKSLLTVKLVQGGGALRATFDVILA